MKHRESMLTLTNKANQRIDNVLEAYGIDREEMNVEKADGYVSECRWVCCYVCLDLGVPLAHVRRMMFYKQGVSVEYAINRVKELMNLDEDFKDRVDVLSTDH
ncbi:MAG: hypothetical protein ACRBG0_19200 [Lewinella sp.]|uniref:hypothetical protein n=1 Tax=Lewinella sp. TaxID=2004506 RepID=UPI003D6C518A